jgi:hypothetical protein
MIVVKKKLPKRFIMMLETDNAQDEKNNIYYLVDGEIYLSSPFTIHAAQDSEILYAETMMIKDLQAKKKMYKDPSGHLYFDLFEIGMWFLYNIGGNDWVNIIDFWRNLMEENHRMYYINITDPLESRTH